MRLLTSLIASLINKISPVLTNWMIVTATIAKIFSSDLL